MKVDFSAKLLDIKGEEIKDGNDVLTLGAASCTALLATFPGEQDLDGASKVKRFRLAEKAVKGSIQELTIEDVAELKRLLGKAFGPLVVGRAYDIIEPPTPETNSANI